VRRKKEVYYKMNFDKVKCPFCQTQLIKELSGEACYYLTENCCSVKYKSVSGTISTFNKFTFCVSNNTNELLWWKIYLLDKEYIVEINSSRKRKTTEYADCLTQKVISIDEFFDLDFENIIEFSQSLINKIKNLESFQ
jgi:hypothetical protein